MQIELYNLADDVSESRDVSSEHPEIVAQLGKLMLEVRVPSEEFPFPVLDKLAKDGTDR